MGASPLIKFPESILRTYFTVCVSLKRSDQQVALKQIAVKLLREDEMKKYKMLPFPNSQCDLELFYFIPRWVSIAKIYTVKIPTVNNQAAVPKDSFAKTFR